jgi:hypothetical protein
MGHELVDLVDKLFLSRRKCWIVLRISI